MKNFKWSVISFDSSPIYVVLFVSRNKDNKHIENFVERRESFIAHYADGDYEKIRKRFNEFVLRGKKGELSRMYVSVNERNPEAIRKELLHFLIDNPDFNLCSIQPKLAGLAAQKQCAATKRWMFDFDSEDAAELSCFLTDLQTMVDKNDIETYKTPHGYAIVVDHGFDIRKLKEDWPDVTLKKDDLLCCDWGVKE